MNTDTSLHVHVHEYDENKDFIDTMDKASTACETSKLIRLARTSGRREADREIESMKGHLNLALKLLRESIAIIKKGEFEAYELSSIEIGTKLIQDYAGIGVGVCGDVRAVPSGDDLHCEGLNGSPDGAG